MIEADAYDVLGDDLGPVEEEFAALAQDAAPLEHVRSSCEEHGAAAVHDAGVSLMRRLRRAMDSASAAYELATTRGELMANVVRVHRAKLNSVSRCVKLCRQEIQSVLAKVKVCSAEIAKASAESADIMLRGGWVAGASVVSSRGIKGRIASVPGPASIYVMWDSGVPVSYERPWELGGLLLVDISNSAGSDGP